MFSCSHSGLINKPKTMSKRQQEETSREQERVVAKSKPMMSLVSKTANRSSASSPGTLGALSSLSDRTSIVKAVAEGLNENTASSSQVWRSGANTNTSMGKLVAETRNKHIGTKLFHYNFQIFNVDHLEKVCSNVRQKLSRLQGDEMLNIDVNAMIWGIFMSAIMKAAVHLGQDYQQNLCTTEDTDFEKVRTLFDISQKLILDHKDEIFGISTIELNTVPCIRTTLLFDKAMNLSKAKVHVYSNSDKASWKSQTANGLVESKTEEKVVI